MQPKKDEKSDEVTIRLYTKATAALQKQVEQELFVLDPPELEKEQTNAKGSQ